MKLNQSQISFYFVWHCSAIGSFQSTKTRSYTLSFSGTDRWNIPYQQMLDVWIKVWLSVFKGFKEIIRWFHDITRHFLIESSFLCFRNCCRVFCSSVLHFNSPFQFISIPIFLIRFKIVGILYCKSSPKCLMNSSAEV